MNPYKLIWLLLAIIVSGFEIFTFATGKPTLTDVTTEYMPWWIITPFLTWLWGHFAINYAEQSKYLASIVQRLPKWIVSVLGG